MKEFYVVYTQGVYRHNISGVFSTIELAKNAAIKESLKEYDGYHNFVVAKTTLDTYVEDVEELFSVSSQDRVIKPSVKGDKYDPRPLSRKICMYNNDQNCIEVLIEMSYGLEIVPKGFQE